MPGTVTSHIHPASSHGNRKRKYKVKQGAGKGAMWLAPGFIGAGPVRCGIWFRGSKKQCGEFCCFSWE